MKAVILAAGVGSRMGNLTKDKPKCMLPVLSDITLIDYQIEKLKKLGIEEKNIFVIGGYKINILKKYLENTNVNIFFNPKFREWNNIYSFYLINEIFKINPDDTFVLLNSDTYFHEDILKMLLDFPKENVLMLDIYKKLAWEEMKVLTKKGKVIKLGKDLSPTEATGEYIGMAKFKKKDLKPLFNQMRELINQGKTDIWYEIAFNEIFDKVDIYYTDTDNKPWIEIDNVDDYNKALNLKIE